MQLALATQPLGGTGKLNANTKNWYKYLTLLEKSLENAANQNNAVIGISFIKYSVSHFHEIQQFYTKMRAQCLAPLQMYIISLGIARSNNAKLNIHLLISFRTLRDFATQ
jgi:hypothetical protein